MSIFTCEERVGLPDLDDTLNLSKKGIVRMMQEAANLACVESGHDITNIEKTHRTWVLLYWRLKILEKVPFNSKITVNTWTDFTKSLYSNRKFELYSNDKLVAIADSRWVFVDTETHSIQKIDDDIILNFKEEQKNLFETDMNLRIKLPETAEKKFEYVPLKRDLDANGHVNNMVFIELALEVIDDKKDFNYMTVVYKKELLYKEPVSCYYEYNAGEYNVYLYSEDTHTLHALVTFKEE